MSSEETAGGALGRLAGKAKEIAGSALDNEELAREGRLQQAAAEARRDASEEAAEARQATAEANLQATQDEVRHERERLAADQAQADRERAIEQDHARAEAEATAREAHQERVADAQRDAGEVVADVQEDQAVSERGEAAAEAIALERKARQAELRADAADPKEDER